MQQDFVRISGRSELRAIEIAAIEWVLAHGTSVYFFNTIISASIAVIVFVYGWTYPGW